MGERHGRMVEFLEFAFTTRYTSSTHMVRLKRSARSWRVFCESMGDFDIRKLMLLRFQNRGAVH